jgi:uncharacterized protein (TIGR00251 family)
MAAAVVHPRRAAVDGHFTLCRPATSLKPAPLDAADLIIHVQPRAAATEVVGPHGDAIKVRVAAPPVDGAANEELVRFLAERFGMRRADVSIVRGVTGRRKTIRIAGMKGTEARERLLAKSW